MSSSQFFNVDLGLPINEPDETDTDWVEIDPRYEAPNTPSSTGDEAPRRESTDAESQEEDNARSQGELVPRPKPGGYDSRVEQMLYENPELPILITDAGKSTESGRYIVYTIKTGVRTELLGAIDRPDTNRLPLGAYRSPALFRVCDPPGGAHKATSDPHHTSDSRKAYRGRVCRQPHQRKAGSANNRSPKAHAGSFLEPVPEDGTDPRRWRLVAVFGSQLELGRLQAPSKDDDP
jgi:hypothetical protein